MNVKLVYTYCNSIFMLFYYNFNDQKCTAKTLFRRLLEALSDIAGLLPKATRQRQFYLKSLFNVVSYYLRLKSVIPEKVFTTQTIKLLQINRFDYCK